MAHSQLHHDRKSVVFSSLFLASPIHREAPETRFIHHRADQLPPVCLQSKLTPNTPCILPPRKSHFKPFFLKDNRKHRLSRPIIPQVPRVSCGKRWHIPISKPQISTDSLCSSANSPFNGVSDEDPGSAVADWLLSCGHTQLLECIWDPFLNGHPKVRWQQGSPYQM